MPGGFHSLSVEGHVSKAASVGGLFRFTLMSVSGTFEKCPPILRMSVHRVPAQPVAATQALNLSAGVSNCKVSRGRSFS